MTERKIEAFWRDATAEDVARVMAGENVYARFCDRYADGWAEYYLSGVNGKNWIAGNFRWDLCQVYDPPQWWLDKPDPGEGWRLLGKFPDEPRRSTDEVWNLVYEKWNSIARDGDQQYATWYRRRIEPVKQDAGSTCASNIPKGWTALSDDEPRLASDAYWSALVDSWVLIGDTRLEAANRDKWPAIRQRKFVLAQGESHKLPNGLTLEVYKKGFEVY